MCGRYRLSRRKQVVEEYFDSVSDERDWGPRYNIAPTQPVPVIRQNAEKPVRELSLMRWGLIPSWAKDASGAASMINARSETASTKPAFADALKLRRCLIAADRFYEWKSSGKSRQPILLRGQQRRTNWALGASRTTAMSNVPHGYYFKPSAFAQALIPAGNASAHDFNSTWRAKTAPILVTYGAMCCAGPDNKIWICR
jgi:putative SOS response-associated peptidase YedK